MKLLRKDTGLEEAAEIKQIKTAMMDREGWRDRARRTSGPPTGFGVIVHACQRPSHASPCRRDIQGHRGSNHL